MVVTYCLFLQVKRLIENNLDMNKWRRLPDFSKQPHRYLLFYVYINAPLYYSWPLKNYFIFSYSKGRYCLKKLLCSLKSKMIQSNAKCYQLLSSVIDRVCPWIWIVYKRNFLWFLTISKIFTIKSCSHMQSYPLILRNDFLK